MSNSEPVKLTEGKNYHFLVEKELVLPDNSTHFLVTGPDTKKYLIPAFRYSQYGIMPGNVIKCKIDKINCRGKVFLEPQNPWYSEGRSYDFRVAGIEVHTDNSGKKHNVVIVTDKKGNRIPLPDGVLKTIPEKGTLVNLKIERISKGKLHFLTTVGHGVENGVSRSKTWSK
jgi:hypothetical protein